MRRPLRKIVVGAAHLRDLAGIVRVPGVISTNSRRNVANMRLFVGNRFGRWGQSRQGDEA